MTTARTVARSVKPVNGRVHKAKAKRKKAAKPKPKIDVNEAKRMLAQIFQDRCDIINAASRNAGIADDNRDFGLRMKFDCLAATAFDSYRSLSSDSPYDRPKISGGLYLSFNIECDNTMILEVRRRLEVAVSQMQKCVDGLRALEESVVSGLHSLPTIHDFVEDYNFCQSISDDAAAKAELKKAMRGKYLQSTQRQPEGGAL